MNLGRIRISSFVIATIIGAAACSGGAPATPGASAAPGSSTATGGTPSRSPVVSNAPVTLRLAVADEAGRPSEPSVNYFVGRVAALSGGTVTIVPTFDAAAGMDKRFEEGVADMIKRGETELGIAASRAWDLVGVTSLQALQAPYLIDSDALADAARDTQVDAIASRQTDAVLAVDWCAQGGGISVASAEQKTQFVAASGPIYARLETDPLTEQLIADIRALKASTPTSDGATPLVCAGG